jgi:hypothetical protein
LRNVKLPKIVVRPPLSEAVPKDFEKKSSGSSMFKAMRSFLIKALHLQAPPAVARSSARSSAAIPHAAGTLQRVATLVARRVSEEAHFYAARDSDWGENPETPPIDDVPRP